MDPANIDRERDLASCARCGRLIDLRAARGSTDEERGSAGASAGSISGTVRRARARPAVQLPAGMRLTTDARGLVVRRPWLRSKHWFLLCILTAAGAYVAYLWTELEPSAWLVIGTLLVSTWLYNLAAMFLNTTVVTADPHGVRVSHGPLPSLFARAAAAQKSEIAQLYSAKQGGLFAVLAKLRSGRTVRLVAPLIAAEQALFIEQQLERVLGLVDVAVEGELGADGSAPAGAALQLGGEQRGSARSGLFAVLAVPVLIGGTLVLFGLMTSTDVSGKLQAKGELGTWAFEPDHCVSGQREGFGGVVLQSSSAAGRVVRVVQDPVRGSLVVVPVSGKPNHVLSAAGCARFSANVRRTSTNINDIWAVDGSLSLDCPELSGTVTFEGCH